MWLILDRYAVDNIAAATAKVKGYEKDDGLRELADKPVAVRQIGYLLLCGGFIVIIVAFMGCCGAAKELRPLLCCVSEASWIHSPIAVIDYALVRNAADVHFGCGDR